tara:strand:+ start:144 stop:1322 length:1179 start_codon:yes stop_codon:yes gene_type:complete
MVNKKVALIGNMNNNFSAFCKYLINDGVDAKLFLLNNDYFHPSQDSFNNEWESYTSQLKWGSIETFTSYFFKEIKKEFSKYDFLIGCGTVPAFFYKAGLKLDVFVPYGSDLYSIPFYKIVNPKRQILSLKLSKNQKKGIKESASIFMAPTGGLLEKPLKKIKVISKVYQAGVPMLYYKDYYSSDFNKMKEKSDVSKKILELKKQNKIIIFHNSRHYWKTKEDFYAIKNNDSLFKGLKLLLQETNKESNFHIVTFEYGIDVDESKQLIKELDIENYVTWLPKSNRKDVMIGMSLSDIVVGELYHSSFSYGVIYEALALKKLIIHKRIDSLYENYYDELYPMLYADGPKTIKDIFLSIQDKPDLLKKTGNSGFDWFKKHMVNLPVNTLKLLLEN